MSAACPVVRDWNAEKVSKGTIEGLLRTNVPVVNIGVLDEPKLELVPVNSPGVLITQTYDDPLSDVNPEIALGTDQYPAWCDLFVKAIFRVEGKSRDEGIYHMGAIYKWWGNSKYVYVPKKHQQLKGKNTPAVVVQEGGGTSEVRRSPFCACITSSFLPPTQQTHVKISKPPQRKVKMINDNHQ